MSSPDIMEADQLISGVDGEATPVVHKTTDEAAAQITRHDHHWGTTLGSAAGPISYGFRVSPPTYSVPDHGDVQASFTPFTAAEQTAARAAFSLWASVANISFADLGSSDGAAIELGNYLADDSAGAFAFYPGTTTASAPDGDVFFNAQNEDPNVVNPGSYEFYTFLHEIGHSLGLEHPGDYAAENGVTITYANDAGYIEDTRQYSVMSYFGEENTGGNFLGTYDETPMLDDIAALQRLYGKNTSTRTGDDTYGFNSTAGSPFAISSPSQIVAFTVYDAGGTDTLDFSGYTQNAVINLNAGTFSSVGGATNNVAIAEGTSIERAIGGSGSDTIITGGTGDVLTGGSGLDRFLGTSSSFIADTITDLAIDETIDITDLAFVSAGQAGGTQLTYDQNSHLLSLVDPSFATSTSFYTLDPSSDYKFVAGSDGASGTLISLQTVIPPDVAFDPSVSLLNRNTAILTGSATDASGITNVEIFEGTTDLGAADLFPATGAWSFTYNGGPGFHTDLTAVATAGDGNTASADSNYTLTTGINGEPYTAVQDSFDEGGRLIGETSFGRRGAVYQQVSIEYGADGSFNQTTAGGRYFNRQAFFAYVDKVDASGQGTEEDVFYKDGHQTIQGFISGQTLNSIFNDTFYPEAGNNTFAFTPGFVQDTITSFVVGGPDHDTIDLPQGQRLGAILNQATTDADGSAVLHLNTNDSITVQDVSVNALRHHRGDFAFHA